MGNLEAMRKREGREKESVRNIVKGGGVSKNGGGGEIWVRMSRMSELNEQVKCVN